MSDLSALLQAAHGAAEAQRVENDKLRDQIAAANAKAMEETIKRLEAAKASIETEKRSLQDRAGAADAAKAAAESAAAASSSDSGGGTAAAGRSHRQGRQEGQAGGASSARSARTRAA